MPTTPRRGKSGSVAKTPAARKPSEGAVFEEVAASPVASKKVSEYKSPEPSILSKYIFFPFYDWIVAYFPRSWVPNYITAFGIACTLLSSFLVFSCFPEDAKFLNKTGEGLRLFRGADPLDANLTTSRNQLQFRAPVEYLPGFFTDIFAGHAGCITAIFFLVAGILNAVYCTADNTDGRQARRTKQTSLIGEYLDHGLDCVTALLSTFLMTLCLGHTLNGAMATTGIIALVTCLSHALHFSDKIFIWGNSFVSVDEAMVGFAVAPMAYSLVVPKGGLGLYTFPAEAVTTVAGYLAALPVIGASLSECVQAFTAYSVVDMVLVLFLLLQLGMIKDLLTINRSNALNGAWVTLWIVTGFFFAIASSGTHQKDFGEVYHGFGMLSFLPRGLLTYPALWATTYCFVASIITHIPIVAQCARVKEQDFWPLSLVLATVFLFLVSPLYGCVFSIAAHAFQVWLNTRLINRLGAKRAASSQ